jgi:hypothetical protein
MNCLVDLAPLYSKVSRRSNTTQKERNRHPNHPENSKGLLLFSKTKASNIPLTSYTAGPKQVPGDLALCRG